MATVITSGRNKVAIPDGAPAYTPWGAVQTVDEIADGILHYTTAGHGGYWLRPEKQAKIPAVLRNAPTFGDNGSRGWYEEDCDWCLVALALPLEFTAGMDDERRQECLTAAQNTMRCVSYLKATYAAWFDQPID